MTDIVKRKMAMAKLVAGIVILIISVPVCLKQRDGMRHSATVLILPVLKITEFSRSVMGELHIIFGIFHPLC